MNAISLDLVNAPRTLSLFNLGNVSANAGFNILPYASALVSLWSPSVSYCVGDTDFTFSIHVGAIGYDFVPVRQSGKVGFTLYGIGASISWS